MKEQLEYLKKCLEETQNTYSEMMNLYILHLQALVVASYEDMEYNEPEMWTEGIEIQEKNFRDLVDQWADVVLAEVMLNAAKEKAM